MRPKNPETEQARFLRAQREWDHRIDKNIRQLRSWRFVALLFGVTLFFVVLWAGSYIQKPRLIPYVVQVQGDQVTFKGVIRSTPLTITDAAVRHYIIRFVTNLRSISSDPVVLRNNLLDLYSMSTLSAQRKITHYIATSNPFAQSAAGTTVDIKFTLFEKIDQHTWRAEWEEQTFSNGQLKTTLPWAGTFSYTQSFPTTDRQAELNPFGLFFTSYYITEIRT